jgi:alpha-L-fucosidase
VVNAKVLPPEYRTGLVEDVERGQREGIEPLPWQTDTCIGDWHYNRGVFEGHHYKSAASVIHRLVELLELAPDPARITLQEHFTGLDAQVDACQ